MAFEKGARGHVQSGLENVVCDPAWKYQFLSKCCVSPEVRFINKQKFVLQVLSALNVINKCLISSWCVYATKVLGKWKGQKWCTRLTPSWNLKSRYDDDISDHDSCSISVALTAREVLVGLLPAQSKLLWAKTDVTFPSERTGEALETRGVTEGWYISPSGFSGSLRLIGTETLGIVIF